MSTRKQIVGGMLADPELKFSQAGKAWATFRVGSDDGKGEDGHYKNKCFTACKAFGTIAENIVESLAKGTRVIVEGREVTEEWESNGEKRSMNVLIVDAIGPDLRFATAKVSRNERVMTGSGAVKSTPVRSGDPWAGAPEPVEPESAPW